MGREKVDFIIKGDYVLTMTDTEGPLPGGAVAVRDGVIVDVGPSDDIEGRYLPDEILGGSGKAVMPGLVNTHTHAAMVYFRGMADDLPLRVWLEDHIWPAEARWLSPDFVRDATELACLEMLKAGVTLYNDMYFFEDASAEGIKRLGMRAVLGAGILDFPTATARNTAEYFEKAEDFIKRWIGDELITPSIAPHAPYTCSPGTYRRALAIGEQYNIPVHTHLCETRWEVEEIKKLYGRTPIEHLDSHGLLNSRVVAAHCVWPTVREIEILAERGVSVSHCLESNLKLASGIAPVVRMLEAGVRVAFGTDGAASNNDLDVMSEMSTAAKLHKAVSEDPTALSARTALLMATLRGAEALGLGDKLGSLEKGKLADIVIVDLNKPHLAPIYNIYSHLVYSAKASDVESVMVNGRLIINGHQLSIAQEEEIIFKAGEWKERIVSGSEGV
ncbi:S-adenosylhomocysteine deaminase; Methylthioadenosine deaminase [hydrothermal vent metagenome]|uniref:S-adenosylhomocysteine deaminase Methylthioadenosine deaminase n=1 Tax=hydrothermal vent metagenome TaxID=652676 RepID=A0A3B1CUY2_9ZZZZ